MQYIQSSSSVAKSGDVYGRYTVRGIFKRPNKYPKYALAACSCGSPDRYVQVHCLRDGSAKSCGCYHKEAVTKHGDWNHTIFKRWKAMIQRCYNPKDKSYKNYGARGIEVCDRWHDYANFKADMLPLFTKGLTLDRINNNLGYAPDNCRWTTTAQQNRNYSRNIMLTHDGRTMCLKDWSGTLGFCYGTLWDRYKRGWSVDKLLTTPVKVVTSQ